MLLSRNLSVETGRLLSLSTDASRNVSVEIQQTAVVVHGFHRKQVVHVSAVVIIFY